METNHKKPRSGYLTIGQIAALEGLTKQAVQQHVAAGRLKSIKQGPMHLISAGEYSRWRKIPRKPGPKPKKDGKRNG